MTLFFEFFTTGAGWIFSTISLAVLLSATLLINQYFKVPGHLLVFLSRFSTVLIMTPFMLHINWPTDIRFYIGVSVTALLAGFADIRVHNIISKYGGGIVSRTIPLTMFFVFPLWFLFDPNLLDKYLSQPLTTLGIVIVLIGCGYFSSNLKKCHVSNTALKLIIPSLLGYASIDLISKYVMQLGSYEGVVFCYLYLQSLVVIPIVGTHLAINRAKFKSTFTSEYKKIIGASALLACIWICAMIFKNTAMISVPNPAYISAIGQLSPVLISIFYYVVKHKEEGDVVSGFGIVVCAILLSLLVI